MFLPKPTDGLLRLYAQTTVHIDALALQDIGQYLTIRKWTMAAEDRDTVMVLEIKIRV